MHVFNETGFFTQENIFTLMGGLGVFLFGIKLMGDSLKAFAGDNLREIIKRFTTNKFAAVLTGTLATVAIQSSSGTTALTISLVRAGLMELSQAIGVIMGANIGTTITAFLAGLSIKEYALPIAFVGALIFMFAHKRKASLLGQIIFGFGMLFYGMVLMENPLSALSQTEGFHRTMETVATNPLLGILIGALLTMIVQSSSATIVVLQGLFAAGAVTYPIAFSILLGDNIGTTITSLLASIGGSKDSQRAAISHVSFNLFGTTLFFLIMFPLGGIHILQSIVEFLTYGFVDTTTQMYMQIAFSHLIFNVTITAILIWFIPQIEQFVKFVIPMGANEKKINLNEHFLDETLVETSPTMALHQAELAVFDLSKVVLMQLENTLEYVETKQEKAYTSVDQLEIGVNALDKKLKLYLRDLQKAELDVNSSLRLNAYMYIINDLERVGDLSVDVCNKIKSFIDEKEHLSTTAQIEVEKMIKVVISAHKNAIDLIENDNPVLAGKILEKEKHLDRMERKYYKEHLIRVGEKRCTGKLSISYIDLISDIERMGDHLQNIAEYATNTEGILTNDESEFDLSDLLEEVHFQTNE